VPAETDECKLNHNICGHGECVMNLSGYTCICYPGYRWHAQRRFCTDVNECEAEPCGIGKGVCMNTGGSYNCHCNRGYQLKVHKGVRSCVDIDECSKPHICGDGGACVNYPGHYKCECHPGYRLKPSRQPLCEDIDECLDTGTCPDGKCENRPGTYKCSPCPPGFRGQHGICYGKRWLQNPGVLAPSPCSNPVGSTLLPELGTELRVLAPSPQLQLSKPSSSLCWGWCSIWGVTVMLGLVQYLGCDCHASVVRGALCNPQWAGGHSAQTKLGCRGLGCRSKDAWGARLGFSICVFPDVDECSEETPCKHGWCENLPGSFRCTCGEGFAPADTVFCDACLATNITRQECCVLTGGWSVGDACEIYPVSCAHSGGTPLLTPPHAPSAIPHSCSGEICKEGKCCQTRGRVTSVLQARLLYDGNLLECVDVDECLDESNCVNGLCENTRGAYVCTCPAPAVYDPTHKKCLAPSEIDVDECRDPGACRHGRCINTQGSFYCECSLPWMLDPSGKECQIPDIQADRAADRRDICWQHRGEDSMCASPLNGYHLTYEECCCRYGKGWGFQCRACPPRSPGQQCQLSQSESNSFWDLSPLFLGKSQDDTSEEDSDECHCLNGRCVRTYHGAVCECPAGFQLDATRIRCLDIDECRELNQRGLLCKNERCINTNGSYRCACKPGFVRSRHHGGMCIPQRRR
uniref:Latent transforming growth factor beta binding protein 3 n=1 Tax=Chelonoidis abingdonii TaxID=106734 RepID=A0A8C0JB78_CHEAB